MAPAQLRKSESKKHLQVVGETTPRVLRIGIVQSGKIVEEKIIGPKRAVWVGPSESNDFVVAHSELPQKFSLFEYRGGSYHVIFSDYMDGRISLSEGIDDFNSLRNKKGTQKKGKNHVVSLNDDARGKVIIGDTTVLFQMINQPPISPKPQLPSAVRGGWLKRVDWAFSAFLALSFIAQFSFVMWVITRDWPATPVFDEDSVYTSYIYGDQNQVFWPEDNERPEKNTDSQAQTDEPSDENSTAQNNNSRPSKSNNVKRPRRPSIDRSESIARSTDKVRSALQNSSSSVIAKIFGSNGGPPSNKAVADVFRGGAADINADDVMNDARKGVEYASNDKTIFRPLKNRGHGKAGEFSVEGVSSEPGDENVQSDGIGQEKIVGEVRRPPPIIDTPPEEGGLAASAIRNGVRNHMGAIKRCYERELRRNPTLSGRVNVRFTIGGGGRVVASRATRTSAGMERVGTCIASEFRRIRFPTPEGGNVSVTHPFFFRPGRR